MTRRRWVLVGAVLAAAVAGSVVTIAIRGGNTAPVTPGLPSLSTATVTRTNLATTALTAGTLGYAPTEPVVNRLAGTYTALPSSGATVEPGGTLYRVDDLPVVLMAGTTPAWRSFTSSWVMERSPALYENVIVVFTAPAGTPSPW